jgi:hypothetical protein
MTAGSIDRRSSLARVASTVGLTVLMLALWAVIASVAHAHSGLCVNSNGDNGCSTTVQAAIDSVSAPSSKIIIQPGTYTASCNGPACSVAMIGSAAANGPSLNGLTLQCVGSATLDATNLDHAVYISGVNEVTIQGCAAKNAARESILVENADNVHIANNEVAANDQAMAATVGQGTPPCPTFISPGAPGTQAIQCCPDAFKGGPGSFPQDNDDCGEGVHLRSVSHSVIEGNSVHDNIGGILVTDETGPSDDNLITNNNSSHNQAFGGDCGITLPSHLACTSASTDATGCAQAPPVNGIFQGYGVFHNAVIGNVLQHNGASGAGVFANPGIPPGAATKAFGNLLAGNIVEDNGQPGLAIHVHAANGDADNNVLIGNILSGNGGDAEAEGSSPPTTGIEVLSNGSFGNGFSTAAPIVGTAISQNQISDEDIDVWVGNTATDVNAFLNDLIGIGATGINNAGTGVVTATDNWWGCPQGPGASGCSGVTGTVVSSPFLLQPVGSGH